jgi:hypothetical protein
MSQLLRPLHLQLKLLGAQWVTIHGDSYRLHGEVQGRRGTYVATPMHGCGVYLVSVSSVERFDGSRPVRTTPVRFVTADEVVEAVAYAHLEEPETSVGLAAMEATHAYMAAGLVDPVAFRQRLAELLRREPDELRTAELRDTLLVEAEAAAEEHLRISAPHENAAHAITLLAAARLARYTFDPDR